VSLKSVLYAAYVRMASLLLCDELQICLVLVSCLNIESERMQLEIEASIELVRRGCISGSVFMCTVFCECLPCFSTSTTTKFLTT